MISVQKVTKKFGDVMAVRHISFTVNKGEIIGLLGPNGAGKTTTMRMITGSLEPTDGRIEIDGKSILDDTMIVKERLGYLPENNPLYEDMLVSEYVNTMASLKNVPVSKRRNEIKNAIESTGIKEVWHRPIEELSKGYRQRVGLAQAILNKPDILVLDEPTEGLDPNQRVEIRSLISSIGKDRTVILSTHVLPEATAICDRLIIINKGKIVADGTAGDLQKQMRGCDRVHVALTGAHLEHPEIKKKMQTIQGVQSVLDMKMLGSKLSVTLAVQKDANVEPEIFHMAKESAWTLWELRRDQASIEQLFHELTTEES